MGLHFREEVEHIVHVSIRRLVYLPGWLDQDCIV